LLMQVIVLSAGRSGTNLILECLTGHSYFTPTEQPEDRYLFIRNLVYPDSYLTKSDTVYIPTCAYFHNFMTMNKYAHIIWTLRHPYDWCLSKLYRGRSIDGSGVSDDATLDGCKIDMKCMYEYLRTAELHYPFRVLRVKMEDVILNIEAECKRMCKWLCIPYQKEMTRPWERMRHPRKRERYGDKLDTSQIDIYKQLPDLLYGGYFKDKMDIVNELFNWLDEQNIIEDLGYKR